ncbi:MAG: L-threonine 3-dehydrogenase [Paludibacteraceae bacterium]|nr:L-threonine 3-dehydrogenase [Paludibacteraceae bacterium]
MKALVKRKAERGIWMEEVPMPQVGVNDVLIKVTKAAICGTDLHMYRWDEWSQTHCNPPYTMGHEFVGVIAEIGSGVKQFKVGERVTAEGHIVCGQCRNCRRGYGHVCEHTLSVGIAGKDGAFAEYVTIPESNVVRLRPEIPDDFAAIMDPFGNATHTALAFPLLGEDVLITGAGLIGTMAAGICRFAGAKNIVVTDINPLRLDIAKKMGATRCVDGSKGETVEQAMEELGIRGFDVGLEMSGAPVAFNDMINHMYRGGNIAQLGILPSSTNVNWSDIIFNAITIKGITGRRMWETWYQMEQMLVGGLDLSPVITHRFKFDDFQKGFDIMDKGQCGKVLLEW